ncbi:hypothetical protein EDD18DRAFT_36794 [Armillaria luteobubalina]|uniref:FAD dependent oxidoreductase domain-containing protein n=1 Tax=Armillaria luteobubalina TaxID=153913 RepID=A0AA39QP63_9AGAR|nr:hypothetical protein EDD18DRAFT_36794 [Armillaria luteobubalina]
MGILSQLLKTYSSFRLYTPTPCLSIHNNIVHTAHGDICVKHIVHTNGWSSHLLAPKIVPVRGYMLAQDAGTDLVDRWLYPSVSKNQWDYLTQ